MIANAPPPAPPRPFSPPPVSVSRLANGLNVIVGPRRGIPLIAGQLIFRAGAIRDAVAQAGISSLAASLLGYGSTKIPSEQFSLAIDSIGGSFSGSCGYESMTVSVSAMRHLFGEALLLAADVVRAPAALSEDLERIRTRVISDLRLNFSSSTTLARLVSARTIYGDHPYGTPIGGTLESIGEIGLADIRALLAQRLAPQDATFVLVGDLDVAEGIAFAERAFGSWQPGLKLPAVATAVTNPPAPRSVFIDLPQAGRSAIILSHVGLPRNDPQYLAATVLNGLLSGYSGRLNREIRVKRGLSYGAGSSLQARRTTGALQAATLVDHARVAETIDVIQDVFAHVGRELPTAEELQTRKAMLRGSFGRTLETVSGLAGAIGNRIVYDLELTELDDYLERLDQVTAEDVRAVGQRIFGGAAPSIVVVGEADPVWPQLRARNFEAHPANTLELRSASLVREDP